MHKLLYTKAEKPPKENSPTSRKKPKKFVLASDLKTAYKNHHKLPRTLIAFLLLFEQDYERSLKASYTEIAGFLDLKDAPQAQHLMDIFREQGYITKKNTLYVEGLKIKGRNIYQPTEKGLKLLRAIKNFANHHQEIPRGLLPLIEIYRKTVRKITLEKLNFLYAHLDKGIKKDIKRNFRYKCQDVLTKRGVSLKKKIPNSKLIKLLPDRLVATANAYNIQMIEKYTEKQLLTTTDFYNKKIKKGYRPKDPWKLYTYFLNLTKDLGKVPTWGEAYAKELIAMADDAGSKKVRGVDRSTVVGVLRELRRLNSEKFNQEWLKKIFHKQGLQLSNIFLTFDILADRMELFDLKENDSHDVSDEDKVTDFNARVKEKIVYGRSLGTGFFAYDEAGVNTVNQYETIYTTPDGRSFVERWQALQNYRPAIAQKLKEGHEKTKLRDPAAFALWLAGKNIKCKSDFYQMKIG